MPSVTNPSPDRVEVHVTDRTFYIEANKSADVSDEEAAELEGNPALKVQSSKPKPAAQSTDAASAAKPQEEKR